MAGGPDEGGAGDGAGTSRPVARTGAAWNGHDDAAVHGIFAAAKAAGATGASVRYGGVLCKVWFEPQGSDTEVADKVKEVQLATAQARLDELERRAAKSGAQKEGKQERRKAQKAKKAAAAEDKVAGKAEARGAEQQSSVMRAAKPWGELSAAERQKAIYCADVAAGLLRTQLVSRMENKMEKMLRLPDGATREVCLPADSVGYEMSAEQLGSTLACAPSYDDKLELDAFLDELIKTKISYAGPFAPQMETS